MEQMMTTFRGLTKVMIPSFELKEYSLVLVIESLGDFNILFVLIHSRQVFQVT